MALPKSGVTPPDDNAKSAEQRRRELMTNVLALLNEFDDSEDLIGRIILEIRSAWGFEAVGVRLRQNHDFPYHTSIGFPDEFVEAESSLCGQESWPEDESPHLACLCGHLLRNWKSMDMGPSSPRPESLWSNDLSTMVSADPELSAIARERGRCVAQGFSSMALIPLNSGPINIGLLQLADSRSGLLDETTVRFFEGLGASIGIGLDRIRTQRALEDSLAVIRKNYDDQVTLLDMLEEGLVALDPDGQILFANKTAVAFLGEPLENLLLNRLLAHIEVISPEELRPADLLHYAETAEAPVHVEVELRGGTRRWMRYRVRRAPDNPDRRILFLRDVSQLYDLRRVLDDSARFHDMVGRSSLMRDVYRRIRDVASVDWTVLIEGDTGTGKDLVARGIHASSPRAKGPFIAVNCAGLSDSILSSQLFGHKRGSFTGAIADQQGLFEAADCGTLFLDEIGDISHKLQTSLLRILEEKAVTRIGESRPRPVDVRVLVATNKDLVEETEKGNFRPDLLYRIRVARIHLPPLSSRREDIPLLAHTFLRQARSMTGKAVERIHDRTMTVLLEHPWPGNVRELKGAIDYATLHAEGHEIFPDDLPPEIVRPTRISPPPESRPTALPLPAGSERERILHALKQSSGNRSQAADLLGVSRATLYRRLEELDLHPELPPTRGRRIKV